MNRTIAYTRISPAAKVNALGLAQKLETLEEYAKAHGMSVVETIAERDSGRDPNRESIRKIRQWLWSQEIDSLLIAQSDDLGEDPLLLEMIRAEAEDCDVEVVVASL